MKKHKKPQGFATMTPEHHKEVSTRGGKSRSKDKKVMAEIGRKGGLVPKKPLVPEKL